MSVKSTISIDNYKWSSSSTFTQRPLNKYCNKIILIN